MFRLITAMALLWAGPLMAQTPPATCEGSPLVVAAAGDILLHLPLQAKAAQSGFESLWQEALPDLKAADVAVANLEGPIDPKARPSGYPQFNYPAALPAALKASGFSVISTVNNHALDRGPSGVDKTLAHLSAAGLMPVGNKAVKTTIKGVRIGWLACTEHTNGILDPRHQVPRCFENGDRAELLVAVQQLRSEVDAVIVLAHWGDEYQPRPNKKQVALAHALLNAGTSVVIGSHPHALQPIEPFTTTDGRKGLIAYSLGNFVSAQPSLAQRSTVILLIEMCKTLQGTAVTGFRTVPFVMENQSGIANIHLKKVH